MSSYSSDTQSRFIAEVKRHIILTGSPAQFIYRPSDNLTSGKHQLHLEQFYRKPVYVCAPHLNFPGLVLPCGETGCTGYYADKQWSDPRIIHGMNGYVSLLQYRYACNKCGHTTSTSEYLKSSVCPDIIRVKLSSLFYCTKKSGVTGDVLQYILNDAISPKSFDDIQMSLASFRKHNYLQKRTEYGIAKDLYCRNKDIPITSMPVFSAIDDVTGYNESTTIPTSEFIIDIFKAYVAENKPFLEKAFDFLPPFPVISFDHTFNTSKRTKEYLPAVEPEYLPKGGVGKASYVAAEEASAALIFMGANGQVNCVD